MSVAKANQVRRFLKAVREVDPDVSVQKLQVLVEVMCNPGIDQASLLQSVDQSRSAVSKNIAEWSAINSRKKPGPGFIESRIDPMNRVSRLLYPTDKGKRMWDKLQECM